MLLGQYWLSKFNQKSPKYNIMEWNNIKFMLSAKGLSIMWSAHWWNYHNNMSYKHSMRLEKHIPNWKKIMAEELKKYPDESESNNCDDPE